MPPPYPAASHPVHLAVTTPRYHLPGERLSLGTVNRYVSDGLVAVADLIQQSPSSFRSSPPGPSASVALTEQEGRAIP